MARRVIPEVAEAFGADPDDLAEETPIDTPAPEAVPVAPAVQATAPLAPITLTFEQLQTLLASKSGTDAQNHVELAAAIAKGIDREKQPENKFSPEISGLNPLGDRDHPRPGLKCDFFLGTQDAKTGVVYRTYQYEADDLTAMEQIALNTLEPATAVIERLDGAKMKVSIVPTRDPVSDEITRLVIVVPNDVIAKGSQIKNMLPNLVNLVEQITGKNFAKLSHEDLAWFMAEHRAKRYVSERQTVAA